MAGQTHKLIHELLVLRTDGNPAVERFLRVHLICKGIDPQKYDADSDDDPAVIQQLNEMLRDYGA